jgi:hypothetical protein
VGPKEPLRGPGLARQANHARVWGISAALNVVTAGPCWLYAAYPRVCHVNHEERRALKSPPVTEHLLMAHGFSAEMGSRLVKMDLATVVTEPIRDPATSERAGARTITL